jgi:hypothetical protein
VQVNISSRPDQSTIRLLALPGNDRDANWGKVFQEYLCKLCLYGLVNLC